MMTDPMLVPNVGPLRGTDSTARSNPAERASPGEFEKALKGQLQTLAQESTMAGNGPAPTALKFSSHAMDRLRDRGISLTKADVNKLENAVDKAAAKGAKETLVLSDGAAFIVSVSNRTVITALDRAAMNNNVFTNIDSTVVI